MESFLSAIKEKRSVETVISYAWLLQSFECLTKGYAREIVKPFLSLVGLESEEVIY